MSCQIDPVVKQVYASLLLAWPPRQLQALKERWVVVGRRHTFIQYSFNLIGDRSHSHGPGLVMEKPHNKFNIHIIAFCKGTT